MITDQHRLTPLVEHLAEFYHQSGTFALRVIPLLPDRDAHADRIADEDGFDESQPVVAVRESVGIHNPCRHPDGHTENQRAVSNPLPWEKIIVAEKLGEPALALVEPLSVGFHAVDRGRVTEADTVLVFGCGMIGLGAIASAALERGARVIAIDISDPKLALARMCGAHHVINSRNVPPDAAVLDLTGGEGPDAAIEAVGMPETFNAAVQLTASAGRVVYIGYAKDPVCYDTKQFITKELDILGSRNANRADFIRAVRLLESGRYPAEQTVSVTVPFGRAAAALAEWSRNPGAATKIHVTF